MNRPRFRADYTVEVVPPSYVLLLSELPPQFLHGHTYVRMAPLLDGLHDVEQILEELENEVSPPEAYYALMELEAEGHVVDTAEDSLFPSPRQAGWDALDLGGASGEKALCGTSFGLLALGELDPSAIALAIQAAGIRLVGQAEAEVLVVALEDYLFPELATVNRLALEKKRPWVLVKPVGLQLWIGPLFSPGRNGCWECLAQRLRARQQAQRFLAQTNGWPSHAPGLTVTHPTTHRIAGCLLANEIVKWLTASSESKLEDRLLSFDLASRSLDSHPFIRRPQCHACGDSGNKGRREPDPVAFEFRPKCFPELGGHSTQTPEEALARYLRHVSPITGVITSLRSDRAVPGLLHGYIATHDFPIWTPNIGSLRQNLLGRSGGQGATDAEGKLSAVGEALERYSGIWRGEEEIVTRACRRDLGEKVIELTDCLLFSEPQLTHREQWNAAQTIPNHIVPNPLDPEAEIDWTPVRSLTDNRIRYLPAAFCYYGHPDMQAMFCLSDSNGCAGGNTLEEAVLSALIELIERDAVALWWYNRVRRPGVSLESFDLPWVRLLEKYYSSVGRDLTVLDITSDFGIPVFAASSACLERHPQDLMLGFGAHLNPRRALVRALSEMNQSNEMVSGRTNSGKTIYATANRDAIQWFTMASRASESYLNPDPHAAAKTCDDFPYQATSNICRDIEYCLATLSKRGIDVYLLDQTRPDLGVPVCRLIAPGLRHFWRRLAPGRLYEVPVSMGWLRSPLTEAELNPLSIFF